MKRTLTILTSVALIIVVSTSIFIACRRPSSEAVHVSLRLKWIYSAGFAGPIVATMNGMFAKEGLNVEIRPGGAALDPIQTVAAGTDDFGITGADRLLQARQKGLPIVAIALENRHSFVGFLALPKSGIKTATDLRGKRIGIFHDDTYTVLQALLKKVGIPQSSIIEVPVGFDLSPLLQGTIDVYSCYVINQPIKLAAENIDYVLIRPTEYGLDFAGNVYFTTEKMIREHPERVQGFLNGLYSGWMYVFAHEQEAIEIVSEGDKSLDKKSEAALLHALIKEINGSEEKFLSITPEDLRNTEQIMRDERLLPESVDLDRSVDQSFIKKVYEKRA
jgi:NitT/TauT family transport system substrate-binding protein